GIRCAYKGLLTQSARWNISLIWFSLRHSYLVSLCYSAVEQDCSFYSIVVTSELIAMLLEDVKLMFKPFIIKMTNITSISILCNDFKRHFLTATPNKQGNVWFLHTL